MKWPVMFRAGSKTLLSLTHSTHMYTCIVQGTELDGLLLSKLVFLAKLQEEQGIYSERDCDLACHPRFSDNDGMHHYRYHQWSLCAMGHLQQLCCAEGDNVSCTFH